MSILTLHSHVSALNTDTVAVSAVLPPYPWYYHGNRDSCYGITVVICGNPMGIGPGLQYNCAVVMGLGFSHMRNCVKCVYFRLIITALCNNFEHLHFTW